MARPHVTLKLATSLDGRIATWSGESRWITSEAARAEVQRMRAGADAVVIGSNTAAFDNPELLGRVDPPPVKQPLRVVLASTFSIEPSGRLFETTDKAPLLIIGTDGLYEQRRKALERAGARTATVARTQDGVVDVSGALALLANEGVGRVLCEGGGALSASLISAGAVDRLEWFRAPILLGRDGRPAVALEIEHLSEAPAFRRVAVRELGPDLWESYERV